MEPERSPKVDAYIAARAPFAQPILSHIRDLAHASVPGLTETIKWSMPSFNRNGKIVFHMAAFKEHATLAFWHGEMVTGGTGREGEAMGSFGRLRSLADLPPDGELAAMFRKAVELIDAGVVARHMTERQKRPEVSTPPALQAALDANPVALAAWNAFAPSHRREYCDWVAEAKREATAATRVAQSVEWVTNGKKRNWKYEDC
jgi:uncharacterized protein YdeI (YjbR/CyaY-like superfamily)